jgi:hypothetical protein
VGKLGYLNFKAQSGKVSKAQSYISIGFVPLKLTFV